MDVRAVSPALAGRLGADATAGLVELIDTAERNCVDVVLERSVERYERRLAEHVSSLRVEMTQLRAELRQDMTTLGSDLRREMATLGSDLRQEMANQRFDLLKWSFLFWIGQVVAMAGIITMLLRTVGR